MASAGTKFAVFDCVLCWRKRLLSVPLLTITSAIRLLCTPSLYLALRSLNVLLLARLLGQYCFARWRLSLSSVTGGPGAWAVGLPTLHGWPVQLLCPVRATPCYFNVVFNKQILNNFL